MFNMSVSSMASLVSALFVMVGAMNDALTQDASFLKPLIVAVSVELVARYSLRPGCVEILEDEIMVLCDAVE